MKTVSSRTLRSGIVVLGLISASATPIWGHDPGEPAPRVPDAIAHQPSPIPDRIVLTWTGDPRTTQAVTWRTSADVPHGVADVALAEAGPLFRSKGRPFEAVTTPYVSEHYKSHLHTAEMTDLEPGTTYAYRVGYGNNFSEWFQFTTAPAEPEKFSFIYFGDAQNDVKSMWSRVIRRAALDVPDAAFMLHAGDLIDVAERDGQWGEWFHAGGWLNGMIPVIATPGNHEYHHYKEGDEDRWRLSRYWRPQFAFPLNGPDPVKESAYFIDYQNVRIVSLNSMQNPEDQVEWMEEVLSDHEQTWTILTFHYPIYSMAKGRDNEKLRKLWKPVLDRHRVDLVLTGHDHTYGRSEMILPGENETEGTSWRSENAGTVYVVSVSGPKMYGADPEPRVNMERVAEDTQLYQIITVDEKEIRYEARTALGNIYDAFTIKKRDGQPNAMISQIPDTPERRR